LSDLQFSVAVPEEDWEAGSIWGKGGEGVGHEVRVGAVLDIQLFVEERHIIKHWTIPRKPRERTSPMDLYANTIATLAVESHPVRKIVYPLRPESNLLYFEGVVQEHVASNSKADKKEQLVHTLIDCSLPFVLERRVMPMGPSPIVESEGDQIIGFCFLWGWLYTPNTLLKAPFRSRVVSICSLDTEPRIVMLTVEPASREGIAENKLHYTSLKV
jgi:hypothetical protein